MLVRYWVTFKGLPSADALSFGCGVTAYSKEDALEIIRGRVFKGKPFGISNVIENFDVSKVTDPHIWPNMGNPVTRGVWFPLGYN